MLTHHDVEEALSRSKVLRRFNLKLGQQIIDRNHFNGIGLFAFLLWLLRFFLWRMHRIGKIVLIRQPKATHKIVKSTDTRCVTDDEPRKDSIKIILP